MAQERLLKRIDERLQKKGLSERKACIIAKVGVDFIRDIRRRGHAPKADKLIALAAVLGVSAQYLLDAVEDVNVPARSAIQKVYLKGVVQAGVWSDGMEWPESDWTAIDVPSDGRFPEANRYGLEVHGTSMDRLYPEGTIVIVVQFWDIGRPPKTGERVVVVRRSHDTGDFEATLKEYEIDKID